MPAARRRPAAVGGSPWGRIASDRRHGAYPLALAALDDLTRALASLDSVEPGALERWGRGLRAAQPAMGTIQRLGGELTDWGARAERRIPARRVRSWARAWKRRLGRERALVVAGARRRWAPHMRVLTFSRSSAVEDLLRSLPVRRQPVRVTIARSTPGGEGAPLARSLRRAGLRVRLVHDRTARAALSEEDILLLGADLVYNDGSLVHKIGTRRLAREARRRGVRTIALAGRSKFLDAPPPRRVPGRGRFDLTPARWISEYWTDRGRTPATVRSRGTR
ncbi:MAG TPA: hypothetical protein VGV89_07085 [Thermoplasmata archaeon]|nr:hypothetical protein [Thermoplasmata archaeon]